MGATNEPTLTAVPEAFKGLAVLKEEAKKGAPEAEEVVTYIHNLESEAKTATTTAAASREELIKLRSETVALKERLAQANITIAGYRSRNLAQEVKDLNQKLSVQSGELAACRASRDKAVAEHNRVNRFCEEQAHQLRLLRLRNEELEGQAAASIARMGKTTSDVQAVLREVMRERDTLRGELAKLRHLERAKQTRAAPPPLPAALRARYTERVREIIRDNPGIGRAELAVESLLSGRNLLRAIEALGAEVETRQHGKGRKCAHYLREAAPPPAAKLEASVAKLVKAGLITPEEMERRLQKGIDEWTCRTTGSSRKPMRSTG